MNTTPNLLGATGYFYTPDEALAAAEKVRDSKYKNFDMLTPFPVHGMDDAMGLGRSWVPWVTAGAAAAGIVTAQVMMVGIMVFLWPMNFGGKPFFAWPNFIPITFELMVLFAGILTAVIAIYAGKKWTVRQPPPMAVKTGATIDKFVVWISADDPAFEGGEVKDFLTQIEADGIRLIDEEGNDVA